MRIVIIGAGQAAAAAIARLKALAPAADITLVGEEGVLPYQRPPLSKAALLGDLAPEVLNLRPAAWYEGVRLALSNPATAIDRAAGEVVLADGRRLGFDRLLLATGSAPRQLPAAIGGDLAGVHVLRSRADALALKAALATARRLVVIGGGYVGLEVAAVAAGQGIAVELVEAAPRILARVAAAETAAVLRARHAAAGVVLHEGLALARLEGQGGRVVAAVLADGRRLAADLVLAGIGAQPRDGLAQAAGLETGPAGGIVTDARCATADPRIFAAGDCALFPLGGALCRVESVQNAIDQGTAAAEAMLGAAADYAPLPWFWSDQYELKLQIAGLGQGHDRVVACPGRRPGALSHWYFAGARLLAVDAVSDPAAHMLARRLLAAGLSPPVTLPAAGWEPLAAWAKAALG